MDDQYFKKRPDLISFLIVGSHLLFVLAPIYLSAVLGFGYHLIFAWLLFGLGMNGIINLMHECAHYHVFKEKRGSELLGRRIIAPLLFTNFEIYRKRHWDHHKHLGVDGETKDTYLIEIKGHHILTLFLRCLFLIEAFKKFFKQLNAIVTDELYAHDRKWALRTIFIQTVFIASVVMIAFLFGTRDLITAVENALISYAFVYLYGLMSLSVFIADLRAIAEHQQLNGGEIHEGIAALRNFKCNFLTRFIMGAYGFGEHFTHHKVPGIPYYALKEATDELAKEDAHLKAQKGYLGTIFDIITTPKK